MYSNIVNPKTGRRVSVKSRLGKKILRQYLFILSGGAALATTPAVGHTEYKKDQDAQYNTVIGGRYGGGSWVDVVILDSPDPLTGMYEIRHRDNTKQVVGEDKLRHIPMNEDWASQSLLMALGTRLPDGSGVDASGSVSHGLRQVVNSKAPMRKIFQYVKPDVDLTVCNATLINHSGAVNGVAVLADGRFVTGSGDATVNVWGGIR